MSIHNKKKRRHEIVEWNTVCILKDHPDNPSWECIHCGRREYGGVTLIRNHILDKSSPFTQMKSRHTEAKRIVEEALEMYSTHKQQTLENFNAAH